MDINNEVISKLKQTAIDGEKELENLNQKRKELHQELLLTYINMCILELYLHSGSSSKRLFEYHKSVQIGDDRIYVDDKDIDFLKTIPHINLVEEKHLLYVEILKTT